MVTRAAVANPRFVWLRRSAREVRVSYLAAHICMYQQFCWFMLACSILCNSVELILYITYTTTKFYTKLNTNPAKTIIFNLLPSCKHVHCMDELNGNIWAGLDGAVMSARHSSNNILSWIIAEKTNCPYFINFSRRSKPRPSPLVRKQSTPLSHSVDNASYIALGLIMQTQALVAHA